MSCVAVAGKSKAAFRPFSALWLANILATRRGEQTGALGLSNRHRELGRITGNGAQEANGLCGMHHTVSRRTAPALAMRNRAKRDGANRDGTMPATPPALNPRKRLTAASELPQRHTMVNGLRGGWASLKVKVRITSRVNPSEYQGEN